MIGEDGQRHPHVTISDAIVVYDTFFSIHRLAVTQPVQMHHDVPRKSGCSGLAEHRRHICKGTAVALAILLFPLLPP